MVKFGAKTKEEYETINEIANRALGMGVNRSKMDMYMDIDAAHGTCPLKLDKLLKADSGDFAHDIYGIISNINRETGELENCFLPRYAR